MYKCKAYFDDGSMEYVIVSTYDDDEVYGLVEEEYNYHKKKLKNIKEIRMIGDSPIVIPITIDAYDMLEY